MRVFSYTTIALLSIFSFGCDPKKDEPPQDEPQTADFSCIKLLDEQGQSMGIHGDCTSSEDWGEIALNSREQSYLNFSDTVSLVGTQASDITFFGIAPCPVKIGGAMAVYCSSGGIPQPIKLKIAVVDESLDVVLQLAVRVNTHSGLLWQIDPNKFESGKYYRMYYRISTAATPVLFEGYGNFLVCKTYIDGVNTTIESDCL